MKTLTEVQTGVRHSARDSNLDITTVGSTGIETANRVYRNLASVLSWPEFTRVDTSLSTTAGTETYDWVDQTSFTFINITQLEMQDEEDNDVYKIVSSPPDEWTWSRSDRATNQSIPDHYRRIASGNPITHQVAFRPKPKHGAKTIRVTGVIEPPPLIQGDSKTLFYSRTADDALEYLIAADWVGRDGMQDGWQNVLIKKATNVLKQLFGKDKVPAELLRQIVNINVEG